MENQDKIFDKFKESAKKSETKDFPAMEKVWNRVEEKLDNKVDKNHISLWKKIAVAASLLLLLSLGYQFFKSDEKINNPKGVPQNNVVQDEKPENDLKTKPSDAIKKDAEQILQKQIEKQTKVASDPSTDEFQNDIREGSVVSEPTKDEAVITPDTKESDKKLAVETVLKTDSATEEQTITGIVSDNSGPLPGANVVVKGTTRGVQTDIDGKFSIVAKKNEILDFSFVGMQSSFAVVNSTTMNVKLNQGVTLSEVVVDGYKTTTKKKAALSTTTTINPAAVNGTFTWADNSITNKNYSLTQTNETYLRQNFDQNDSGNYRDGDKQQDASVGFVKPETKNPTPTPSVIQTLQGKVAGLNITNANEQEEKMNIVLRGFSSITGNSEPLYVIDGVVAKTEDFKALDASEIKSINILKDAGATALYGNRGSNGVIVISTKENTDADADVEAHDFITAKQKIEVSNESYDSFIENPFESPKNAPLSTFSIDVDNASYTNVRRFINNGQSVPKDAVRVEEMVNFFKYQYPQPQDQHPFSINTEYSDCPWNSNHKLLKIGLQGKNIPTENLPASNLVFLIDVSGSMDEDNKLPLLVQSMKVLINELRAKDKVTIVVYAGAAGMVLKPTSGSDKKTIIDALEHLEAGGSTAGGEGIELAYKMAQENFIKGGNNRVVLATDGDFNVGDSSDDDMQKLIEEKRKSGVFLTCLGFGMGNYKDSKMEILSDKGNGNYAYIDNIQEANRFLGKEFKGSMFAIAKDVKIQIEFNPKQVQSYRLIGYENRKLRPEDFTNDAIDAGELGSGHSVTALYEVIPTGVKSDYFNETPELKYTQTQPAGNFNDELATVKFRYKKPDGDTSIEMVKIIANLPVPMQNTSDDFKFSAAVAWFGLKLRDSKLVGNKSSEAIIKLAKEGLSNDEQGYKAEFIRLVEAVK